MVKAEHSEGEERGPSEAEVVLECVGAFADATAEPTGAIGEVVERVGRALDAFCIVLLPTERGDALEPLAHFDCDTERGARRRALAAAEPTLLGSDLPAARVFRTGEPVLIEPDDSFINARFTDPERRAQALTDLPRAVLILPLRARGRSIGVFTLIRSRESAAFSESDRRVALALAGHAALAIRNVQLVDALRRELEARELAQSALATSEARLREIFDAADEGIWVTDANRRTVLVNRRMAEMMHETPEEMIGRSTRDYATEEDRSLSEARFERRKAGIAERMDVQVQRRDGTRLDARICVSSMRGPEGRYLGAVSLVTDMTESKQRDEQLRQSQRMEAIGSLAGGIAHDFNNILSVILSLGHVTRERLAADDPSQDDLAELCAAAERAAELTRQILAFSRKQILQPTVVETNRAVMAGLPMLRRILGEHIDIRTVLAPDVGRIRVDPSQLEQVIMNLAVNARDAMPGGGTLTLETENVFLDADYVGTHMDATVGPHVLIAVSDTGCGMGPATLARVFEPFFTTKPAGRGTGLGLATVHGVVRQSGGTIWVYSEEGRGTTFKVYFPRTMDAISEAVAPKAPRAGLRSATILLVEDDPKLRAVARDALVRAGNQVLDAALPLDALKQVEGHPGEIHLLITDVVMPQMSGRQLAQRLTQLRPSLRVLYMSGYTENTIVHDGILDPEVAFLAKPITPHRLLEKVAEVLAS